MKKICVTIGTGLMLANFSPVYAESGEVSFGLKGGTLGIGIEAGVEVSEYLEVRGGVNYLKFDFDTTISEIDYNFEPEFFNGSLLLDWHPFANAFRFTAGSYINNNKMDVEGTYRQDLIPADYAHYAGLVNLAKVEGSVEFNTFAPYLGLGWTSNHADKGWGMNMDCGVMFQGKPNVTELHVDDPWGIGDSGLLDDFLEGERQAIEDDIDEFQYYPVMSVSVSYKF